MVGHVEVIAIHLGDDFLSGFAGGGDPLDFGGASAVAGFQVDGEVEGSHLVDFVSTNIGPNATHVQGQWTGSVIGTCPGVSCFWEIPRKRTDGSQRGVRLVYPSPGHLRVRQPPTRAGTFLTGHPVNILEKDITSRNPIIITTSHDFVLIK